MKRSLILIVFLVIIILVAAASVFFWWGENTRAVSNDSTTQDFLILKGKSASQIGETLYRQKLIRSPLAFKIYVQLNGKANRIQSGEFRLSPNLSLYGVVEKLLSGPTELWVTIPEGLRREEVVERYVKELEMDAAKSISFRKEFLEASTNLEGFLFPDTYLFPRDADAKKAVLRMKEIFDTKVKGEIEGAVKSSDRSLEDIVTMASIIERETKTNEERPIVAGILWKRLDTEGWLIQADATLQYANGTKLCVGKIDCNWWPTFTAKDLEKDSPYNSYKYKELPPTPIANPGLASIKAAAKPTTSEFWFYIHDKEGTIHYATTIEEHNQNVAKFLDK
ncbi:hypothetical protein A2955_04610 [Candidatus Woesebacteria bacterium RIFCSPLOWO2_01_FULL_37_19]|uniref:Endolytic murein transglycosylase n=2 Tax=Candidatus Woeseibacteriota TaxID=1752722 RepID=A0A1F8BAL6_9BACT|nr:MAG: hypothetical protein A2771_01570 [Candidatus Woesebacteria bacterium RIFCSPHIGHO2_01_FULL_38_26b]OGM61077.1 MAG: hypothetical protein A2955_04610 [Candidatus Woesebacteria bacterium RIFCSPLOWO2_01_FULL_37_19]